MKTLRPLNEIPIPSAKPDQMYALEAFGTKYTFKGLKALLARADYSKAGDRNAKAVYDGMASILWLLMPNPVAAQRTGLVGQEANSFGLLAAVEDRPQAVRGTGETRGQRRLGVQHGRQ